MKSNGFRFKLSEVRVSFSYSSADTLAQSENTKKIKVRKTFSPECSKNA